MINFRPITKNDFADLCSVLQDKNVMYAWEHAFSDEEDRKSTRLNSSHWW